MTDIAAALEDVLNTATPLDEVIARHFSDDYRQRTDGVWSDRQDFAAHLAHLRTVVAAGTVEVLDELRAGTRYAERHVVHLRKRDGGRLAHEVYVFAELDESGRFRRLEEVTLMLSGDESERGFGSAR